MKLEDKKQIVEDLHGRFAKSSLVILTGFKGLDVASVSDLRRKLKQAGIDYKVAKNTLMARASEDTPVAALKDHFQGPGAVAISYEDPVAPAALFAEEKALFRYEPARIPPDERIALERGPLRLAMEGVRRKWLEPRLDAVLGGAATLLSPSARALPPGEMGLGPDEQRVLQLSDGLRTLDEILDTSPLPPLETRQVLAGLLMVGAFSLRFHGSVESRRESQTLDLARVRGTGPEGRIIKRDVLLVGGAGEGTAEAGARPQAEDAPESLLLRLRVGAPVLRVGTELRRLHPPQSYDPVAYLHGVAS